MLAEHLGDLLPVLQREEMRDHIDLLYLLYQQTKLLLRKKNLYYLLKYNSELEI